MFLPHFLPLIIKYSLIGCILKHLVDDRSLQKFRTMNYRVICYALTCQFVHLLRRKNVVPTPPTPTQNHIQKSNNWAGALQKKFLSMSFIAVLM